MLPEIYSSFPHDKVGKVSMPRMYPPRLSPEQCKLHNWLDFSDGMQPFWISQLSNDVQIAFVDKTSLWAPSDACSFIGSSNRSIDSIADLSISEGEAFLRLHQRLAIGLMELGNIHRSQYGEINVAFGFNPEDFQLGAHSIKRLHTHIFTPRHWITDGRSGSEPLRREVPLRDLSAFDRNKFFEPYSLLFYDYIEHWLKQNVIDEELETPSDVQHGNGLVSMNVDYDTFPYYFSTIQHLYCSLRQEYSTIEALFTGRDIDPQTDRFLPRPVEHRQQAVEQFIESNNWLSEKSSQLLRLTARDLCKASRREPGKITSASELWFTKGFAGALMFSFNDRNRVRLDIFPRVIATSGVERAVYGLDRPTLIVREERDPTEFEAFENNKFLLAVKVVLREISHSSEPRNEQALLLNLLQSARMMSE